MLDRVALGLSGGVALVAALALAVVAWLEYRRTREPWRLVWWLGLALTVLARWHWLPGLVGASLVTLQLLVTGGGLYRAARAGGRPTP